MLVNPSMGILHLFNLWPPRRAAAGSGGLGSRHEIVCLVILQTIIIIKWDYGLVPVSQHTLGGATSYSVFREVCLA